MNGNQLIQHELGESNITSVACNIGDNISNVNGNLVRAVNFLPFQIPIIWFTILTGSILPIQVALMFKNVNTSGSNSRINAFMSSGTSLGFINHFGTSGTQFSNTCSSAFNSRNNAFGWSGTFLPINNSNNAICGVNTPDFRTANSAVPFYQSSAIGNSIMFNTVLSLANLFTPFSSSSTSNTNLQSSLLTSMHMPNQIDSVCTPLFTSIPQSLKDKIVKGEFVDFGFIIR